MNLLVPSIKPLVIIGVPTPGTALFITASKVIETPVAIALCPATLWLSFYKFAVTPIPEPTAEIL